MDIFDYPQTQSANKINIVLLTIKISLLQSITILLCHLIRNTCPFNTYYFAKYYYITLL